uniref:Uncharacterized protein n=1 Tax=Rhizophora mucronata TaxID=61149 RepID=A0A2P2K1T0_RHIMU
MWTPLNGCNWVFMVFKVCH